MANNEDYQAGRKVTWVGLGCNAWLFIIKLLAGIYGNSQALVADAIHTVSDLATDVVVLVGLKFSHMPKDEGHPYGHEKIETLSALIIGLVLIYVALGIGLSAGKAIYQHQGRTPKTVAFVVAVISLVSKEVLFRYTIREGKRIRNQSIMANAWHHRSDAFSSVATVIGVGAAAFIPTMQILDAYAALIVAFIIVKVGSEISCKAGRDIVDTAPRREVRERITAIIKGVDGVLLIHGLHTRYSGKYILADVHIQVAPHISVFEGHNIATKVKRKVMSEVPEVMNVLVHIEPANGHRVSQDA